MAQSLDADSLDADEGRLQWHEETGEPLQRLADYVTGLSQSAIGKRGAFSVFMSGSSFLSSCLRNLTVEPHLGKIDWSNWHVVWTNETFVPPDQLDLIDNTLGHDGLLSKVPPAQVHILDIKLSPQDSASVDYELVLRDLVRTRGSALPLAQTSPAYPRFDLVIVGSELDELVASVVTFPPVVQKSEIRTSLSEDESRPPPLDRCKFTLPLINSGANVSLMAARSGKEGMKLICSSKSPFGDIPASASAAAPHKANLVWFKQIHRQTEGRGIIFPFGEGELFGCCASTVCDHTFHWQSEVGGIYRPTLEVVRKLASSFLISPAQRKLVLEHARNGLKNENVWNWGEAIEHYEAMDAELGKQLEASERKETNPQRTQLIYLWLHTWAVVPILWFQQFAKGEILDLNKCIAGWEKLRTQWPSGTLANLSIRRHQALAMLELSHHDRSCIDAAAQAAAVELYPNERSPSDGDFTETLPRMTRHLHQHHTLAADEAKAKLWLQKTLEILAGHDAISMPLYPVVLAQIGMLEGSAGMGRQRNSADLKMAQDLMRKLEADLEKRKGSRVQIESNGSAAVGDVAARWRDIKFATAFDRHNRQFPGAENFTSDKSVEYSLKIIEKDLSTDTFANCLRTSKYFIVQERFEDALRCLDLASQKLPREPGLHNLQRRVVLGEMALCHLLLSRKKPEAGFSHVTEPSSSPLLRCSEPYFRNVIGLDDADIQAAMRQVAWDQSHSDGSTDVHLENVVSCCREASALSSLPGGFTVLRFRDLSALGVELVKKESSLFAHWCRVGEVMMEVYLEAWNDAWGVLHTFSEMSSRLMHARWNPLYIEKLTDGSGVGHVFETLYELLSHKLVFAQGWFLKTLPEQHRPGVDFRKFCPAVKPVLTLHGQLGQMFLHFCGRSAAIDCTVPAYALRKLIYSERGRARTLLLKEGSLLTTEARDHFLKFSLDDNFAGEAMRRSISACGGGCLLVSLNSSSWRIYITCFREVINPFSRQVQGFVHEVEIEDEACFTLRGILQKTLGLLSSSWLRSQLEEKSRRLDECLEQLFEIVVRPIEGFLKDMNPEQKLIFCASKDLSSIPFPILRNRETGRYLFQDHTVSVTPSLRVLHPCSQRYEALQKRPLAKKGNGAAGVVIADPKYPDEGSGDPKWRRLQGSGSEANKICSLFSGSSGAHRVEKLEREKATVENLLCEAHLPSRDLLSYQGFIHVAAHAKVDKRLYPRGVLVLSSVLSEEDEDGSSDSEESDSNSDAETEMGGGVAALGSAFGEVAGGIRRGPGAWKVDSKDAGMMVSADGIASCGFEWSAALVVLSACDSVKGELYPEGVHNLPRAFMMAGVPCVVVSQWNVSDEISPQLMEIFYTSLREGKDVASALRFAMCQMLEEGHCLYLFAPFLVWGLPNVHLPEELQSKPTSQDMAAGSESTSNLAAITVQSNKSKFDDSMVESCKSRFNDSDPAMVQNNLNDSMIQSNSNVEPRVVDHGRDLTGNNVESSSSDHEKTLSLLKKESSSSSGTERDATTVPPSPAAENAAPEAKSSTTPSTSPEKERLQELSLGRVLLDNVTHNYLIDKTSAGIGLRIGARALTITLGDDSRCWTWVSRNKGATFSELAFLREVSRLEVKGRFQCSLPAGAYTLSWRLRCFRDILAVAGPLFHGYIDPLKLSLEVTGNSPVHTCCRLTPSGAKTSKHQSDGVQQEPGWRWDPSEWMELDAGEFSVANDDSPVEVMFSMAETDERKSKRHLLLDGIVVRPSTLIRQDQAILASRTSGSGSGLPGDRSDFLSYNDTGTAHREALLARPAPTRGDHDAWERELLLFKTICRNGLANEDHSYLKAAKAESQLESMRAEIDAVNATNARLEHARKATSMTVFGDLQRVMQEKSALEAEIVRLQEQLLKVEANDRGKKKLLADDV